MACAAAGAGVGLIWGTKNTQLSDLAAADASVTAGSEMSCEQRQTHHTASQ